MSIMFMLQNGTWVPDDELAPLVKALLSKKELTTLESELRFLVFMHGGTEHIVLAGTGPLNKYHDEVAADVMRLLPGATFLGAGYVSRTIAYFCSSTCKRMFGYYKPKDPVEAETLHKRIYAAIALLLL